MLPVVRAASIASVPGTRDSRSLNGGSRPASNTTDAGPHNLQADTARAAV